MTILQRSTFQGLAHNLVRPGAKTRKTDMEDLLKDSAVCYESLTSYKAPSAASISATPHVHDGTNGAIIRLPLSHGGNWHMGLNRRSGSPVSGGVDYSGFYPIVWVPFYAPPGVDEVIVVLFLKNSDGINEFRATVQNTSLADTDSQGPSEGFVSVSASAGQYSWLNPGVRDYAVRGWEMSCTAGTVNVLRIDAWDGRFDHTYAGPLVGTPGATELPPTRAVRGYAVLPVVRRPPGVTPKVTATYSSTATHLLSQNQSYVSYDSALVANDRAVPSYLLTTEHKNFNLLYEATTGQPAALRGSVTVAGHNHREDGDGASLDVSGADIDHSLGSWAYGVLRPPPDIGLLGASGGYSAKDMPKGDYTFANEWWGTPIAPCIDQVNATSGTYYTVFEHIFRMPAVKDLTSAGGNIRASALVYNDSNETMNVRFSIGDTSGSYSTTATAAASGSGDRQLVTTLGGIACGSRDAIRRLKVEIQLAALKGAHTVTSGIYGVCLWYEAD